MADPFESYRPGLESPATRHYEVQIDSGSHAVLDPKPRFLYVMTSGLLEIVDEDDVAITYPVTAGQKIEFRAAAVGSETTAEVAAWY